MEILKKGSQTPKHPNHTELSQTGLHTLAVRGLGVLDFWEPFHQHHIFCLKMNAKRVPTKYGFLFEMLEWVQKQQTNHTELTKTGLHTSALHGLFLIFF